MFLFVNPSALGPAIGLLLTVFGNVNAAPFDAAGVKTSIALREPTELTSRNWYVGFPRGPQGGEGPDTTDYPLDDEIRNGFYKTDNKVVFYTNLGPNDKGQKAKDYAASIGGKAYDQAYQPYLVSIAETRDGRSDKWYGDFIDRFSGILAEKISRWGDDGPGEGVPSEAHVLAPPNETKSQGVVRDCSVWQRMEYETLRENTNVIRIWWINSDDTSKAQLVFDREQESGGTPFQIDQC